MMPRAAIAWPQRCATGTSGGSDDYRIEVYDPEGRRVNVFTEVPLLEVTRTAPDQQDTIRGVLPDTLSSMGPGHSVKVFLEETLFTGGAVVSFSPHWAIRAGWFWDSMCLSMR